MKLSSLFIGMIFAVAVIAVLLMVFGVSFHRPLAQGAALYNPANEVVVKGAVHQIQEFACPVSEGEMGAHLMLKTGDGLLQVHLAPARIMRSQNLTFAPGDQIEVVGAKFRFQGEDGVIAREIIRGNESFIFRDPQGKLLMMQ
ncbi:MAG: hypothetical protein LAN83_11400 [Acidobacteriia bacterium]|nr:hypothetical protein [Terriglobia bacterium]